MKLLKCDNLCSLAFDHENPNERKFILLVSFFARLQNLLGLQILKILICR